MSLAYQLAHYFFPRHSNNHRAKILHSSSLFLLIFALVAYQIMLQAIPISGIRILGYAANIKLSEIVSLTNDKRVEVGLSPLQYNETLAQAAKAKGEDMLEKDYWAHVAPDGAQPWSFFIDAGYKYRFAGENLARDFSNSSSAIEAWMASPSHKDNLLSSKYKDIGIAVVEGDLAGVETTIIVQLFGAQYSEAEPQIPVARAQTQEPAVTEEVTPVPEIATGEVVPVEIPSTQIAQVQEEEVRVSPFDTTRGISLATVALLFGVMVVDGVVTSNKKITRAGGRTFAHLAFLGMILAIIFIARAGEIL